MANGAAHRLGAALAVGGVALIAHNDQAEPSAEPLAAAGIAYMSGTLPDILEPAYHPNHRQFCHSLAFAGMVGFGMYKAYKYKPETTMQEWLRFAVLAIGGAYLVHLAMDGTTPKGLPIL